METLSEMTFDKFKLWTIHALKVYLSLRKKAVNGTFDELAARAFCAWEEDASVDEQAELAEHRLLNEYKTKLVIDGDVIPDPFSLTTGWKGENTAMNLWPSIYITDIATYLNYGTPKEVLHRLLNEYKEGKAYRYFDSEWVKEIFIYEIGPNSDKVLMKAKCMPSMRINNKCYDVWISVRRDTDTEPGGQILSGYCSCTAGMHGTCNHIAGVLFRIEHAVKTGETKKSSTSIKSTWNVPKGKADIRPTKVQTVTWRKGHYTKVRAAVDEEKLKMTLKQSFTPLNKTQNEEVKNLRKMRNDLHSLLKPQVPLSCFVLTVSKERIAHEEKMEETIPPSIIEVATELKSKKEQENLEETFIKTISLTKDQCDAIANATVVQSFSQTWRDQRKGRLTASNFHRINSRVNTLKTNNEADPSALIATVIGNKSTHQTSAMKHGISLEPNAKKEYTKKMKKQHKKFRSNDTGLMVHVSKPFIAASADLETECDCCGKGLCEIKCPEKIKDTTPSVDNVSYLLKDADGSIYLDKKHPYYFQIQGQLGIHNREFCDLFVFSFHGSMTVRVIHDHDFWKELEDNLNWFWMKYMLPKLLADDIENKENCTSAETPTKAVPPKTVCRALEPLSISNRKSDKSQAGKMRKVCKNRVPIYLCGICGCDCLDDPQSEEDQSVNCDICGVWSHYICAGVTDKSLHNVDKWACRKCRI